MKYFAPPIGCFVGAIRLRRMRHRRRHRPAGDCSGDGEDRGDDEYQAVAAEGGVEQPEGDGRKKDLRRALHAAVETRGGAAFFLRRDQRQERVAAGVQSGPADAAQAVGQCRGGDKRHEAEKNGRRLKQRAGDHYAGFAPAVGPVTDQRTDDDAGDGEAGEHDADDDRRRSQLGEEKR